MAPCIAARDDAYRAPEDYIKVKEYKIKLADMDQAVKVASTLGRLGIEMEEVGAAPAAPRPPVKASPRVMPAMQPAVAPVDRETYLAAVRAAVDESDGKMGSIEAHLRKAGLAGDRGKVHRALKAIGAVMDGKLMGARWGLTKEQAESRAKAGRPPQPERKRKAKGGAPRRTVERAPEAGAEE